MQGHCRTPAVGLMEARSDLTKADDCVCVCVCVFLATFSRLEVVLEQ
jgi:hypothetical protein